MKLPVNLQPTWDDPASDGNNERHRTGKKCIDCDNPAGTAWSHLWCIECNARRMNRINKSLAAVVESFESQNESEAKS